MRTNFNEKEVLEWHQITQDKIKSELSAREYCLQNNINESQFYYWNRLLHPWQSKSPKLYEKIRSIAVDWIYYGGSSIEISKKHNVNFRHIREMAKHLCFLDILKKHSIDLSPHKELFEDERSAPVSDESPKFYLIPDSSPLSTKPAPIQPPETVISVSTQESEIMEKQNDIEINITKGVKVIIAPSIEPQKIIKIIELLKDL